ncbi:hypothetical protein IIB79_06870 [candidate division KSB1 bacterium]|nr:hypothetical protein [candidate division KSB1 bacterium]
MRTNVSRSDDSWREHRNDKEQAIPDGTWRVPGATPGKVKGASSNYRVSGFCNTLFVIIAKTGRTKPTISNGTAVFK